MELRILDVKHLDALVVKIEVLEIIKLLQNEMARIEENITARMIAHALQKHLERRAIVQVFARMKLKAKINTRRVERVQNRLPARGQLIEGSFDESRGALGPRINVRP